MTSKFQVGDRFRIRSYKDARCGLYGSKIAQWTREKIYTVTAVDPACEYDVELVFFAEGVIYARRCIRVRKVITAQGIFNHVYRFMLKQGRRSAVTSYGDGNKCFYRSPDGACCAAGCLLTDGEAQGLDDLEWTSWLGLVNARVAPRRFAAYQELIFELQRAHDRSDGDFAEEWKSHAAEVASRHGLKVPTDV